MVGSPMKIRRIESLDLMDCSIGDEGLAAVCTLVNIEAVILFNNQTT
jgi:hypothetical protein